MPEAFETPAVLVDRDVALANVAAFQEYCDKYAIRLRPHIKTHKIPAFAKAQVDAGAAGITCQKISEAEIMATHGVRDILVTCNIIGAVKLECLLQLSGRLEKLAVVADNEIVVRGLGAAFASSPEPVDVLVECDTGGKRCGVQSVRRPCGWPNTSGLRPDCGSKA